MSRGGLSIARKLYLVVGVMAVLIAGELMTLRFSMNKLSAVRAFVGGEGTWSKAQKNAAFSLQRYALSHNESDYADYLNYLKIPEGDHRARLELLKRQPDMGVIREGFLQGNIHPDDIQPMVDLLRRFYWVSYLHRAIGIWADGDRMLAAFEKAGSEYHSALLRRPVDYETAALALTRLRKINEDLTALEEDFSDSLGAGSRWMEGVVIALLSLAVLMVESIGLTLTFKTSRRISHGLAELNSASARIGHGDFSPLGQGWKIASAKPDEIGTLARSLTTMGRMLEKSYRDLESRVRERTAELETMAEQNASLYRDAKAALESRDDFLSIASHELKTPLSALLLQLQLMGRHQDHTPSPGMIKATQSAKRLARLIDELLDLTRIRTGQVEISLQDDVDLRGVLAERVAELMPDAAIAGATLSFAPGPPVRGRIDPLRLGQVVTNLVSNAIKYGEGKPIEVELVARDGTAEFSVRDHGRGIPPEKQELIFERFERAGAVPGVSGLGLGLYVVRQIVVAHGGRVTVASRPGEGAAFTVRVPLAQISPEARRRKFDGREPDIST